MSVVQQGVSPQISSDAGAGDATAAVGDSLTVAVWTVISRVTGVLRGITVAAVLGATFFANTYQFTNSLPNLVYYGFLGGVLFTSLLVPALVHHIDAKDSRSAARVAGGFFGLVVGALAVAVPLAMVVAVLVTGQSRVGILLILLLMPQVPLYAVVGSASAVLNAHRKFALAAAAPAVENIGTIVVLGFVALLYPASIFANGTNMSELPLAMLLLLGLGTTGSVGLHAALQWWGARRVGVTLVPRAGWRDPEVRKIIRRAVPALVQAGLQALQLLVLLVLANRIAGGVVAFQLAMNFYFLPIALAATPVALSLAPRLSRMAGDSREFVDTYLQGLTFALFLAIPAAAGYLVLSGPLAQAISYGGFDAGGGSPLVAAALAGLAIGVVAETVFMVTTYAYYARNDTTTPLRAMVVQVLVGLCVAAAALFVDGPAALLLLGLSLSIGGLVASWYLARRLVRGTPRADASNPRTGRTVLRILGVAAVTALASWLAATAANALLPLTMTSGLRGLVGTVVAVMVGAVVYFGLQAMLRAPELTWVAGAIRLSRVRTLLRRVADRMPFGLPRSSGGSKRLRVGLLLLCLPVGVAAGVAPELTLLGLLGSVVLVAVVVKPAVAAYLVVVLTPLTAGIDRGSVIPLLRPNEGIVLLVGAGLFLHWLVNARTGSLRLPKLDRLDFVLVALALCNSVVPIAAMLVRQQEITADDLQHAIVLWKYLLVYILIRYAIRRQSEVLRAVWLSIMVGALVCVIGVLQALGLFGIPDLLGALYAPYGVERTLDIGRGGSTLALPAAVADLAILNLALAVALILRGAPHRRLLGLLAIVCAFGVGAAGEFSSMIGLVVAVAALILVTGARRLLRYILPVGAIGGFALWPVIETRLAGFQGASGIPDSWLVRYYNLTTYFWPDLFANGNWVFGVQPAARVPAAHEEYGWVWIESGHTWLLWSGGVPLLLAYGFFIWITLRRSWAAARYWPTTNTYSLIGTAVFAVIAADIALMVFDPHLTYRGAADAMYILLALLRPMAAGNGPRSTELLTESPTGERRFGHGLTPFRSSPTASASHGGERLGRS